MKYTYTTVPFHFDFKANIKYKKNISILSEFRGNVLCIKKMYMIFKILNVKDFFVKFFSWNFTTKRTISSNGTWSSRYRSTTERRMYQTKLWWTIRVNIFSIFYTRTLSREWKNPFKMHCPTTNQFWCGKKNISCRITLD